MSGEIDISVIMPTYNSERTLEESLKSLRNQDMDQKRLEILIVDGGSNDRTLEIAKDYNCRVLHNEKKLPEFAKELGFLEAKGEWGIFLDSDEMILSESSFSRRLAFLGKHKRVKNLVSTGMSCAARETGINRYANFIGDPFSNFVYKYNGYNRAEGMNKKFAHKCYEEGYIYSFKNAKYYPLFDALGNMFNIEAARKIYEKQGRPSNFVANIFISLVSVTNCAAMLKDDFVMHKPGMSEETYKSKLVWRVKNNLFATKGVGFAGREDKTHFLMKRKILFILYSGIMIPVLFDAVKFSVKNKDVYFMNHFFYNEYTFFVIAYYVMLKILGVNVKMDEGYGKK